MDMKLLHFIKIHKFKKVPQKLLSICSYPQNNVTFANLN